MKLSYWVCDSLADGICSIRARTRKEANAERQTSGHYQDFSKARKVVIVYKNSFDLVKQFLSERVEDLPPLTQGKEDEQEKS